jgi:hypothetical protein
VSSAGPEDVKLEGWAIFTKHAPGSDKFSRRRLLAATGALAGLGVAGIGRPAGSDAGRGISVDDYQQRAAKYDSEAIANFPFKRVQVRGADALNAWRRLKAENRGTLVVIGDDESLTYLAQPFDPSNDSSTPREILDAASRIRFPEDLFALRKVEDAEDAEFAATWAKLATGPVPSIVESKEGNLTIFSFRRGTDPVPMGTHGHIIRPDVIRDYIARQSRGPQLGEWPSEPSPWPGLSIATDLYGEPLAKVYIAIIPTDDWTTVPAYLRWGGWGKCPDPEYHVAALRSWRARYGVELVGLSFDVMNLRTAKRPSTREIALALAREQYAYCSDIIDQGTGTLSALAATLMVSDWWNFRWD